MNVPSATTIGYHRPAKISPVEATIANAVAGPIGDKLGLRSSEEILSREMMLQAILSIQAGDNPRVTQDKMIAFVPVSGRKTLKLAA